MNIRMMTAIQAPKLKALPLAGMMWKSALILIVFFIFGNTAHATRGCQGQAGPNFALYTSSISPFTDNNGVAYSEVWTQESGINNPNSSYCITTTSEPCKVKKSNSNTVYTTPAFIVDYSPTTTCPIDDYVSLLVLVTGIAGVWSIRKRNFRFL